MNLTQRIVRKPLFAMFLSFLILFTSCQPHELLENSNNLSNSILKKTVDYDAEEIFKSIVFGDGAYTHKIPALHNLNILENFKTEEEINTFRNTQSDIIEYIKKRDKNYFNEFKKGILSGNPTTISNTLGSASKHLTPYVNEQLALQGLTMEKAISSYKESSSSNIRNFSDQQHCVFFIAAAVIFIGIYLSMYYARYVEVTYANDDVPLPGGPIEASFGEEEIIISIMENF